MFLKTRIFEYFYIVNRKSTILHFSAGNGAAMRIVPVAIYVYRENDEVDQKFFTI